METIVALLLNPDNYDLGLDLMWETGLDYNEVVDACFEKHTRRRAASKQISRIMMDHLRWLGAQQVGPV